MIMEKSCRVCNVSDSMRCAKCKAVYYCSTTHQHIDWPNHKTECLRLTEQKKNNKNNSSESNTLGLFWSTCNNLETKADKNNLGLGVFSTSTFLPAVKPLSLFLESENDTINRKTEQMSQNSDEKKGNPGFETTVGAENFIVQSNSSEKSNDSRYEDLCRNIINDMNTYGLSVVDDFLGMEKGLQILNEVHRMYAAGVFKDGQLVSNVLAERDLRTIRGDKITWVKGVEAGCVNVGYLINQIDTLICRANIMENNGKLGNYSIRERTKAMVACYPGSGSHYVMHVDNPNRDGRVITAIYYLNVNWDTKRSGGVLRIFPEHGGSVADIDPKFDRLIFFWSDKRNPHEVQPAHRTRYAITVWYFDANEREAALNRCRKFSNPGKTLKSSDICT